MLKPAMKQNCKPLSNWDDPQPRFVNGPHSEARTWPDPEITNPNSTFGFEARVRPESRIYRVSQDLRNRGYGGVAK